MSGPIRSQIGPAKRTMTDVERDAQTHIGERPADDAPIIEWSQWVQRLKNDKLRLENAIGRIDTQITRWTDLMLRLDDAGRQAEDTRYNGAANGEDGFLQALENAHEMVAVLSTNIEFGTEAVNRAAQPVPQVVAAPQRQVIVAQQARAPHVRLPKTNLPEFDGSAIIWPSFWDAFKSAIDSNPDYSDVDKFNYLNGCLRGDAKKLIQGYFVTAANYPLAVNKLTERYGDEEKIKKDLRTELQRLPAANKYTNSVRKIRDDIERILLQLEQLGEDTNQSFVLSAIENKMPKWILLELEKSKIEAKAEWDSEEEGEPFNWDANKAREALSNTLRLHEVVSVLGWRIY